jgi:hypothetical protein
MTTATIYDDQWLTYPSSPSYCAIWHEVGIPDRMDLTYTQWGNLSRYARSRGTSYVLDPIAEAELLALDGKTYTFLDTNRLTEWFFVNSNAFNL